LLTSNALCRINSISSLFFRIIIAANIVIKQAK